RVVWRLQADRQAFPHMAAFNVPDPDQRRRQELRPSLQVRFRPDVLTKQRQYPGGGREFVFSSRSQKATLPNLPNPTGATRWTLQVQPGGPAADLQQSHRWQPVDLPVPT